MSLGIALLLYIGCCWFRRETVVFPFDLPELDRPIDFAQLILLPWAG
jgi:hypothetical protein